MKTSICFRLLILLLVAALSVTYAGSAIAQEFDPNHDVELPDFEGDPAEFEDGPEEEPAEAAEAEFILTQPPYTMNYMGYVTDGGGDPLNDKHDFVVSLWNAESGGAKQWGDETHADVQVSKGLFNLILGSSVPLETPDFGQALFLQVSVDGTDLPRQPLRPSAYAFGIVPGAVSSGDPAASSYGLSVYNTGSGSSDRGIYAQAKQYAIYANSTTPSGISIYTADYVRAGGYKSTRDSWYWTAGMEGEYWSGETDVKESNWNGASAILQSMSGAQNAYFYIPIHIPSHLFGQNVNVEQIRIRYKSSNSATYINNTYVYKQTDFGNDYVPLVSSTANRTSTTPTSYYVTPANHPSTPEDDRILSWEEGILLVRLDVHLDHPTHALRIGGVGVRLGHQTD